MEPGVKSFIADVINDQIKVSEEVDIILGRWNHARNSDLFLIQKVLEENGYASGIPREYWMLFWSRLPEGIFESIRRSRQKLRHTYPPTDVDVEEKRGLKQAAFNRLYSPGGSYRG